MKKVYLYTSCGCVEGPFDTIQEMLDSVEENEETIEDVTFYEAVEGEYVPPSTPATVRFP